MTSPASRPEDNPDVDRVATALPTAASPLSSVGDVLLRATRLTKVYPDGDIRALVGVDLAIRRGEVVAIMGPSGSGKSTLLNILGLLEEPTTGTLELDGQPVVGLRGTDRVRARQIGFVFQAFHLLPMLTAIENVQVPMFESRLARRARRAKAARLLELVGLGGRADHLPLRLSAGERQRVAIARTLANDPQLLLADEPTGNLDTRTGRDVLDLLLRLHRESGMTILLVTHDPNVAHRADRVIHLRDGRIESERASAERRAS